MKYRILCLLSYGAFRLEIPALILKREYSLWPLERTKSFALCIQDGVKAKVSNDTCSSNFFAFSLFGTSRHFREGCWEISVFVVFFLVFIYLWVNKVLSVTQNFLSFFMDSPYVLICSSIIFTHTARCWYFLSVFVQHVSELFTSNFNSF